MSLVARHLEANGIPTLVIGSAMDIAKALKPPRYLHIDFPLGNPCGKPYDRAMQREIILQALRFFASATTEKPIERTPFIWDDEERYTSSHSGRASTKENELGWRDLYSRVDHSNCQLLAERGATRRELQKQAKIQGSERSKMIPETGA